ncbi:MAG: DNA polymerase III subunit delta [Candidatus Saccharimonadales bacterium]
MITVLFGANRFTLQQRLAQIRDDFVAQYGPEGVETFSAEHIEPNQLPSLLVGATLFSTHRLVIINNLTQQKELTEQFSLMLTKSSDGVQVILVENQLDKRTSFYKTLKKSAVLEEFTEPDEMTMQRWAESFVKDNGGVITTSAASYFVQRVGLDQLRLKQELEKLLSYDPKITQETVDLLVEKTPQQAVFQLLEYAFSGRQQQALQLLSDMERAHEDPFQLVNMLIWQTHVLAVVASASSASDSQVAKEAKLSPYVVQKTRNLARNLRPTSVRAIVDVVTNADIQLKSSSVEPWRVLELAVVKLG